MHFPILTSNQCAVMMANSDTGIILNVQQEVHDNNSGDAIYSVFESVDLAMNFIKKISEINDNIEFVIYDYKHQVIKFIKAEHHSK